MSAKRISPKGKGGDMRWVCEGIWSGYQSSQQRVCHRKVITKKWKMEALKSINTVEYTDGTRLYVTVRTCLPREKVKEIDGYSSMLQEFINAGMKGYVKVADLNKKEATIEGEIKEV